MGYSLTNKIILYICKLKIKIYKIMNKFKVIHEGKEFTITAQGWNVGIGGYYIFFNDKNETVAIAPPTALIGNFNSIK